MYDTRPKRDPKGKVMYEAFQSHDVSHEARIQPDRRWFGGTRTVDQDELSRFREEVGKKLNSPATYMLKPGKVPFSLLKDAKAVRPNSRLVFPSPMAIRFSTIFGIGFIRII
jgi:nuclear GTP-binding protein